MSLLIAEVKKKDNYLPIPEIIQDRLGINKYSKIIFVIKHNQVILQVSNPPVIIVEREDGCYSDVKKKMSYTIIRNDFICQNPKCNNPILKNRGRKNYCCLKCAKEHKNSSQSKT